MGISTAVDASHADAMRPLPSISRIVSDVVLSTATRPAQRQHARDLIRTAVGLLATFEGDTSAAAFARRVAGEREANL